MKRLVVLSRALVVLSIGAFVVGIVGLIYWRWIHTASSITAAWRDALSTFEVFAAFAIFLAVLANYFRVEAGFKQ